MNVITVITLEQIVTKVFEECYQEKGQPVDDCYIIS